MLFAIHSVSTFEALDTVVTWKTFSSYLALSYEGFTLLGSLGSCLCGLISMLLGAMGTIVFFVILTTIFVGLFVDYEIYGKFEEPKIKRLKTKKLREKVASSDSNLVDGNLPNYSFASNTESEISVDAMEYENQNEMSSAMSNYTQDDVVDEISDDAISGTQSDFNNFDMGKIEQNHFSQTNEYQTKNEFSNEINEPKTYPDVYSNDMMDEHRRQFMHATFGGYAQSSENINNSNAQANPSENNYSQPISTSHSNDLWGSGENETPKTEAKSSESSFVGEQNLDDELSKILSSSEDEEEAIKSDVFGGTSSSPKQPVSDFDSLSKNQTYENSEFHDDEILKRNAGFGQTSPYQNPSRNSNANLNSERAQMNQNNFDRTQNSGNDQRNGFGQTNADNPNERFNGQGYGMGGNFGQQNPPQNFGENKNFGANQQQAPRGGVVIPSKEIKQTNNYGVNLGMTGLRYNPPPLSLLRPSRADSGDYTEEQNRKSAKLENVLSAFNIPAKVKNIVRGPKITRFELSVPLGVSVKKIPMYEDDIAAALAAKTIVIKAPIPGSSYVGIELENDTFTSVSERELLESDAFQKCKDPLPIAIGKDISGEIVVKSLAKMVHLLIAGSTGSGKSVFIHNIVLSLIYKSSPDDLRLIMIDPKKVEFNRYNGLPHLLTPEVVMGSDKAINALKWCVKEMDRRYDLMSKAGYNNIEPYNKSELVKAGQFERFPYIVIIVDELAEIMMVNKKEVEACIQRITQLARACGMHLILATQRPSVDIISGVIKNNVPSRIAFSLQSAIDSKTILNVAGAEKLLGQGDMIFAPTGTSSTPRLQAAYASDEEIKAVIDYDIKYNQANYDETVVNIINSEQSDEDNSSGFNGGAGVPTKDTTDSYFKEAVRLVIQNGGASTSYLQRRLSIGYSRAARIIDQMEDKGYIAGATGSKLRKVLITPEQFKDEFGEDFDAVNID